MSRVLEVHIIGIEMLLKGECGFVVNEWVHSSVNSFHLNKVTFADHACTLCVH